MELRFINKTGNRHFDKPSYPGITWPWVQCLQNGMRGSLSKSLRSYVNMLKCQVTSASCLNCSLHHYACRNDLRGPRVAGCEVRSLAAIDAQAENMAHIPIQWL